MDRKSKIWQIVLLALLIAAIIAIVIFNNRLKNSSDTLSTAIQQLKQEQESVAALRTELDEVQASYDEASKKLKASDKKTTALEGQLTAAQADIKASGEKTTALEEQLTAAQADVKATGEKAAALEEQLAAAQADSEAMKAEYARTTEEKLAAVKAEVSAGEEKIKSLEEQLAAAQKDASTSQERLKEAETRLADARAEADSIIAKLEAEVKAGAEKLAALEASMSVTSPNPGENEAEGPSESDHGYTPEALNESSVAETTRTLLEDTGALQERIDSLLNSAEDLSEEERLQKLDEVQTDLGNYVGTLTTASAVIAEANAQREEADATLAEMQTLLEESETRITDISGELDEKLETIDELNEQIETLTAQSDTDAEKLADLQADLDAANAEAERQSAEIEENREEYERQLAEVEAYRVDREPAAGEAHSATSVGNEIHVAADGVTASWDYHNTDISSNPVVLSLQVEGETVYTSQPLLPGQSVDTLTLSKPLAPGSHEGLAVSTVYDEEGNVQFANRVPVTVVVAE